MYMYINICIQYLSDKHICRHINTCIEYLFHIRSYAHIYLLIYTHAIRDEYVYVFTYVLRDIKHKNAYAYTMHNTYTTLILYNKYVAYIIYEFISIQRNAHTQMCFINICN